MKLIKIINFLSFCFFIKNGLANEIIWNCPNNYGSEFEYKIKDKEVYIKENHNWKKLHSESDKFDYKKTSDNNKIIYIILSKIDDIKYKEIYDLKNINIQFFSNVKNKSQILELLFTKQCRKNQD